MFFRLCTLRDRCGYVFVAGFQDDIITSSFVSNQPLVFAVRRSLVMGRVPENPCFRITKNQFEKQILKSQIKPGFSSFPPKFWHTLKIIKFSKSLGLSTYIESITPPWNIQNPNLTFETRPIITGSLSGNSELKQLNFSTNTHHLASLPMFQSLTDSFTIQINHFALKSKKGVLNKYIWKGRRRRKKSKAGKAKSQCSKF